ncbi:pectinesterase-like [Olea europaea subsp. europaea]|uniref:Pectinesterase-like n=1 Tax=Olea europaea subsp. europaea TaxID=158383 RepID=A0A8S0R3P5_OLEEU|nr:pectinesterase-like [Olea europaea subsp. europaea]
MDWYQDTLYIQTHRQFYRNYVIPVMVDFIFGDSAAIIQNSLIMVVTAREAETNAAGYELLPLLIKWRRKRE